jgi:hypothetical protein
MARSGLTRTERDALALFLLGREICARYAGNDAYDFGRGEEPGVRIPGVTFRALLDRGYLESATSVRAMPRWRISWTCRPHRITPSLQTGWHPALSLACWRASRHLYWPWSLGPAT